MEKYYENQSVIYFCGFLKKISDVFAFYNVKYNLLPKELNNI